VQVVEGASPQPRLVDGRQESDPMSKPPARPDKSFDWKILAPSDEDCRIALEEYHAGRSFPEIVDILESRGLSGDVISQVTTALAKDRAFYLFSAGKKVAEVRNTLIESGLNPEEASNVARAVESAREELVAALGMGKWQMRSLIAGGILLTVGVTLCVLKLLAVVNASDEVMIGLVGSGVVLAGFGGIYIAFGMIVE
jgi:hypothetical protein